LLLPILVMGYFSEGLSKLRSPNSDGDEIGIFIIVISNWIRAFTLIDYEFFPPRSVHMVKNSFYSIPDSSVKLILWFWLELLFFVDWSS